MAVCFPLISLPDTEVADVLEDEIGTLMARRTSQFVI